MSRNIRVWLKRNWGWPYFLLMMAMAVFSAKWLFALYIPFLQIPGELSINGTPENILAGLAVAATWVGIGGTVGTILDAFFQGLNENPPKKTTKEPKQPDWR